MAEKECTHIFYYFIHAKLVQEFGCNKPIYRREVIRYIAQRFRVVRQIHENILWDMESLHLIHWINKQSICLKQSDKYDYLYN